MSDLVTRIGPGGRVVLPAAYRRALGLEAGDRVVLVLGEDAITVLSPGKALARAQEVVRRYVPQGTSLSSELIAERRREAAREEHGSS